MPQWLQYGIMKCFREKDLGMYREYLKLWEDIRDERKNG